MYVYIFIYITYACGCLWPLQHEWPRSSKELRCPPGAWPKCSNHWPRLRATCATSKKSWFFPTLRHNLSTKKTPIKSNGIATIWDFPHSGISVVDVVGCLLWLIDDFNASCFEELPEIQTYPAISDRPKGLETWKPWWLLRHDFPLTGKSQNPFKIPDAFPKCQLQLLGKYFGDVVSHVSHV